MHQESNIYSQWEAQNDIKHDWEANKFKYV